MAESKAHPTAGRIDSPFFNPVPDDGAIGAAGATSLPTLGTVRQAERARSRELAAQVDLLDLAPIQRAYLKQRWLSELAYLSDSARRHQRFHYLLRITIIVGGVIVPALVGLHVNNDKSWAPAVQWLAFIVGLIVAIAAALEGFFRWGDRWRHFRLRHEQLFAEGWAFLELAGAYRRFDSHREAFRSFVTRVEDKIGQEVQTYITEVVRQTELENQSGRKDGPTLPPSGDQSVGTTVGVAQTVGSSEPVRRP
jgi:hypothetical protein